MLLSGFGGVLSAARNVFSKRCCASFSLNCVSGDRGMPKARIIKMPSDKQVAKLTQPYLIALGALTVRWTSLQDSLLSFFRFTLRNASWKVASAAWHSIPSDRTQRNMLLAAIDAYPWDPNRQPKAKEDLEWLVCKVGELSGQRAAALHSGYVLSTNIDGTSFEPAHQWGNRSALKLKDKDLIREFERCILMGEMLSGFSSRAYASLLDPDKFPWPDKPPLQHFDKYLNARLQRQKKTPKRRPPPHQSSPG
jgi:hypothetical protein